MKRAFKLIAIAVAAATLMMSAGCGGRKTVLSAPDKAEKLSWSEESEMDPAIRDAAKGFAAKFSAAVYTGQTENFAVSPVTVYLTLGLAAECASGETREELLSALGVGYETLSENYSDFYRSLLADWSGAIGTTGRLSLANSVWLQEGVSFRRECVDSLAEKYLCYSYATDFKGDNGGANKAVRGFVKEHTEGLIDRDFRLDEETRFTLVSTLYLKDLWNHLGDNLPFAPDSYSFAQGDGTRKDVRLLTGDYCMGRTYEGDAFTHFYTRTTHGYKLKFILPKEGHTVREVFTAENLALVNGISDYHAVDDENKKIYNTRCLFPEFEAAYNGDLAPVLQSLGIKTLFEDHRCDLSALTDEAVFCGEVPHSARLKVNKKGIEGAAVVVFPGAGAPGPSEYEEVYEDFVLDRAFGFVLTDSNDTVLFSGVVNFA